jgi:hypothetical protein
MMRLDDDSTRYFMNSPQYWLYFWIDALCIDQDNKVERSEQVRLMSHIFTDAAFVLVWLGENGEDGESAMRIISAHSCSGDLEPTRKPGWVTASLESKAVRAFCRRPYWKRLWIVQEVILARDILVCCGSMRVEWDTFEDWYLTIKEKVPDIGHITSAAGQLVEQKVYWTSRRLSSSKSVLWDCRRTTRYERIETHRIKAYKYVPSLTILADSFLFYECSDVRDKVYGLLGLVDDRHLAPLDINVDYTLSPLQLFEDVIRALYEHVDAIPPVGLWDLGREIYRFRSLLRVALGLQEITLDYGWLVE